MLPDRCHALQEGAAEPQALLGLIRLVGYLSNADVLGQQPCTIIVGQRDGRHSNRCRTVAFDRVHQCFALLSGLPSNPLTGHE